MLDIEAMTSVAHAVEQENRCRKLFASVVLVVLDDTIRDRRKCGHDKAMKTFDEWLDSEDAKFILECAGIEYNETAKAGLHDFIVNDVLTTHALTDESRK